MKAITSFFQRNTSQTVSSKFTKPYIFQKSNIMVLPFVRQTNFYSSKTSQNHSKILSTLSRTPDGPLYGTFGIGFKGQIAGSLALSLLTKEGALGVGLEPKTGDPKRSNSSPTAFNNFNVGTYSIVNDKSDASKELLRNIFEHVHFIIDNRSNPAKQRDSLLQNLLNNPEKYNRSSPLIYCSITGYGDGDERKFYDRIGQASSGMAMTNSADGIEPQLTQIPLIDIASGQEAAKQIISNLLWIERQKNNQQELPAIIRLDVSMMSVAMNFMSNNIATFLDTGQTNSTIVPFGFYKTQDKPIAIATATDEQFAKLCKQLKIEQLAKQYPTNSDRLRQKKLVEATIEQATQNKTSEELIRLLEEAGIACSKVNNIADAIKEHGQDIIKRDSKGNIYLGSPTNSSAFPGNKHIGSSPDLNGDEDLIRELVDTLNQKGPGSLDPLLSGNRSEKRIGGFYGEPITQEDLANFFNNDASSTKPSWAKGSIFYASKTSPIKATQLKEDREVHTETNGTSITKVKAFKGDWLVTTQSGTQYTLTNDVFNSLYEKKPENEGNYKPKSDLRKVIQTKHDMRIKTHFGIQYIPAGSYIVYKGNRDIYGIHQQNFENDYTKENVSNNITPNSSEKHNNPEVKR